MLTELLLAALLTCATEPDSCIVTETEQLTHVRVCDVVPRTQSAWGPVVVRRDSEVYAVVIAGKCRDT